MKKDTLLIIAVIFYVLWPGDLMPLNVIDDLAAIAGLVFSLKQSKNIEKSSQ